MLTLLFTAIVVVCTAGLLLAEHRKDARQRYTFKPLASVGFVLLAWQVGVLDHPWGLPMLIGFGLCCWGDVLLLPTDDKRSFLLGIVAFALGHVGFATAFLMRGVSVLGTGLTASLLLPVGVVVYRWLRPHLKDDLMRTAVPVYIVVICSMVSLAVGTTGVSASGSAWGLLAGAVLFWLSDLCVARERFVVSEFRNKAVGLPLYYGAQLVLAFSCWSSWSPA